MGIFSRKNGIVWEALGELVPDFIRDLWQRPSVTIVRWLLVRVGELTVAHWVVTRNGPVPAPHLAFGIVGVVLICRGVATRPTLMRDEVGRAFCGWWDRARHLLGGSAPGPDQADLIRRLELETAQQAATIDRLRRERRQWVIEEETTEPDTARFVDEPAAAGTQD